MLNFYKKHYYKIILIVLFLFFLFLSIFEYTNAVFSDISDSVFRLHIIANSDTNEDQALKLKVRDSILKYINSNIPNASSKKEMIDFICSHKSELKEIAVETVKKEGYNYEIKIETGNFYFPTKEYENISLPAGNYDGLKIVIGNGNGHNWWCVMFPPLCLIDKTTCKMNTDSLDLLEKSLTKEEFSIISDDTPDIRFKFKLIELFNK